MRSTLSHLAGAGLLLGMAWLAAGCDDACLELSKTICRCESTQSGQAACIRRVEGEAALRTPTVEELERCTELLDTCDCDQLSQGEYAACGLSIE